MLLLHKNIHPIEWFFIFHQITFFYLSEFFFFFKFLYGLTPKFTFLSSPWFLPSPHLLPSLLSPSHLRCGVEQRSLSDEHNSVHDDSFTFNTLCTFGKMWQENKEVIHFYFSQLTHTLTYYIYLCEALHKSLTCWKDLRKGHSCASSLVSPQDAFEEWRHPSRWSTWVPGHVQVDGKGDEEAQNRKREEPYVLPSLSFSLCLVSVYFDVGVVSLPRSPGSRLSSSYTHVCNQLITPPSLLRRAGREPLCVAQRR